MAVDNGVNHGYASVHACMHAYMRLGMRTSDAQVRGLCTCMRQQACALAKSHAGSKLCCNSTASPDVGGVVAVGWHALKSIERQIEREQCKVQPGGSSSNPLIAVPRPSNVTVCLAHLRWRADGGRRESLWIVLCHQPLHWHVHAIHADAARRPAAGPRRPCSTKKPRRRRVGWCAWCHAAGLTPRGHCEPERPVGS
eukprot:366343-Chlamydomonas_euryale.AAC.7